jgi:hypothetical protein
MCIAIPRPRDPLAPEVRRISSAVIWAAAKRAGLRTAQVTVTWTAG